MSGVVDESMAGAIGRGCPDSFGMASFGPLSAERYDGFATVIACGLAIDAARWQDRLARIAPIRRCDVVPGEGPPYARCVRPR